jgi:hypothetical protein
MLKSRASAVVLCVLAACGGDARSMRGRGLGGQGGAAGVASSMAGGGAGGSFENPDDQPPVAGTVAVMDGSMMPPLSGARIPMSIDDCGATNPAGLSEADAQKLMAGGSPGALRFLYPYDATVFPRGILPPTVMWDGEAGSQVVYLHIKSRLFEYKGCLLPSAEGQLLVPDKVWEMAGAQTEGNVEPYVVELSVMSGGNVVGPVAQHWTVAQATLKGSIYYNSYSSALGGGLGGLGGQGAVLRIPRGGSAEGFLGRDGCIGCHSVSANGERLIALPLIGPLGLAASSYGLTPDVAPFPPAINGDLGNGAFPGLSPDGALFITSAHGGMPPFNMVGPRAGGPGAIGGPTAGLFETDSATEVAGAGVAAGAMMATFSPDGTQITFTDLAIDGGHGLAVMSFDAAARSASNYREIYRTGDARFPGWPFFLPDGKAVVFANGDASDFSGLGAGIGLAGGVTFAAAPASDLYVVDAATGTAVVLARAMGFATEADFTSNNSYLPFGADDLHKHYYPTIAPVAAGGYFWIFFDSIRNYGNQGVQRQIWGAAIDVSADGTYSVDGSHPAFYLTGQEANTGNHRAFAALDPCEDDGEMCTSGTDCCGGFCFVTEIDDEFQTEPIGTCTSDVPECAKINERCTTTGDCCEPEAGAPPITCIAGFCAVLHGPD